MAKPKLSMAVALVDLPGLGVPAGHVLQASATLIDALQASGDVDSHKDAIAAAHAAGRPIVRLDGGTDATPQE